MGGGIGVTPMIAMAHRLHSIGANFALHYSASSRDSAGFLPDLAAMPWANRVQLHFSDENSRADLPALLKYSKGHHVYTCGPDAYMQAVIEAATNGGFPEAARHLEYFTTPEQPEYVNHAFTLRLIQSQKDVPVTARTTRQRCLTGSGHSCGCEMLRRAVRGLQMRRCFGRS